jgi:hypothetical protein
VVNNRCLINSGADFLRNKELCRSFAGSLPPHMNFSIAALAALAFTATPVENNPDAILGHWTGIDMFQDESSYDGKTVYLPNDEEIVISKSRVCVYFYPYFKSDEFAAVITPKSIVYSIGRKRVKSEYSFIGDTLVLSMNFINKNFIKMYQRKEMDAATLAELNEFGFNPSTLEHEYELDTLHKELRRGFKDFDSLGFDPVRYIQFIGDHSVRLDRNVATSFERGYQVVRYTLNGNPGEFKIQGIEGTQQFEIIPTSLCQCDSITLPYLAVSWANRIRKQIVEDTW